jgi:hypothetical protein
VLDTLHGLDLDFGFLVAGEVDVGQDQEGLRAVRDIESAVEAEFLHAAFLAFGSVEGVSERDCFSKSNRRKRCKNFQTPFPS